MAGTSYQLTIQVGPNPGKTFPLNKPEMVIGRDVTADIVISDVEVSRKHAHLIAQQGGYLLEDLGSTNGTVVNGLRLTSPYLLHPGEQIVLGEHVTLVFETAQADPEATQINLGASAPRTPATLVETPAFVPPPVEMAQPEQMPPPPYDFAGQVPAGPVQVQPEPIKSRIPTWVIILIVAVVVTCACIGAGLEIIDVTKSWCKVFPFLAGCP
jgi:pSer/pThr/pTyr-binding forkhead associated (FHA) protein